MIVSSECARIRRDAKRGRWRGGGSVVYFNIFLVRFVMIFICSTIMCMKFFEISV